MSRRRRIFGKEPPRVPDPGQRVRLHCPDGVWREGFRAVSGPLTDEVEGFIVWVAEEEEWESATVARRSPVTMPWPLERLEPDLSPEPY